MTKRQEQQLKAIRDLFSAQKNSGVDNEQKIQKAFIDLVEEYKLEETMPPFFYELMTTCQMGFLLLRDEELYTFSGFDKLYEANKKNR